MGSKTIVELYDDIDGSTEDIRTVSVSLDGKAVELDLSQKNYDKVAEFLEPYLSAGRKPSGSSTSGRRRRASAAAPTSGGVDTKAVRAWAAAQNVEISSRGRISAEVLTQYEAAQK